MWQHGIYLLEMDDKNAQWLLLTHLYRRISIDIPCYLFGLISFPLSSPEHEQIATQWIKWLSKEEAHYEAASGVHASFGEILLLIAIHFHSNQTEAIADLVCSVLGMKIRLGSLTRMKTLFTQEIFPEKVCYEETLSHATLTLLLCLAISCVHP